MKYFLQLPLIQEGLSVTSETSKYVHEVLVNRFVKLASEKKCGHPNMTIAVDWDVNHQTKQIKQILKHIQGHLLFQGKSIYEFQNKTKQTGTASRNHENKKV